VAPRYTKHLQSRMSRLRSHSPGRGSVVEWGPPALYLVLLYFRNLARVLLSRERTEAALIVILCASILTALSNPSRLVVFRRHGEVCWGLVFVALLFISALSAGADLNTLAESLYHVVSACLVFLVFSSTARSPKGLSAVCATLTICAAINAGVTLWGAVTQQNLLAAGSTDVPVISFGYDASNGRSGGLIGENYTGLYNLPAVIAGLALLRRRKWWPLGVSLVLLGGAGTIVTLSRASILAVFCGVAAFVALNVWRTNGQRFVGTLSVMFFMSLLGVVGYNIYFNYLPTSIQIVTEQRFSQSGTLGDARPGLWRFYVDKALNRPLLGNGPGYIRSRIESGDLVPHNAFLDVAVEFGLPALVMFSIAMFRPLAVFTSARRNGNTAYLYACFMGALPPLFTLSSPFLPLVWAMSGAVVGASRNSTSPGPLVTIRALRQPVPAPEGF
jgi:O-antigen ligase